VSLPCPHLAYRNYGQIELLRLLIEPFLDGETHQGWFG
jgi:hypothetical protein